MKKLNHTVFTGGKFSACILIFIMVYFIILNGCKKDSPIKDTSDCIPIPPYNQVGFGYDYITEPCIFRRPFFNPNNDNEFLYVTTCAGVTNIMKYNLLDKSKTQIWSGAPWSRPRWGKKDFILFGRNDANIYRIKSNGDSLTQLTSLGNIHHPNWNINGDKFLAFTEASNLYSFIFDLNGNLIDTIDFGFTNECTFQNPNYIVSNNSDNVMFYNLNTNSIEYQIDYSYLNSNGGGSIFWLNNSEVIFSHTNGLNKLSIPSLKNHNFKNSCNSKQYSTGDINSSKTKMIWASSNLKYVNNSTLIFKSRINIMNVDGSDEQEIDLN